MWDAVPRKYGRKAAAATSPTAPWAGESSWLRFPAITCLFSASLTWNEEPV